MGFDLFLDGGRVFDPATETIRRLNLAIDGGRIVEVVEVDEGSGSQAPKKTRQAEVTIPSQGLLYTPAWVDAHAHFFHRGSEIGFDPDFLYPGTGVLAACDGGSAGPVTLPALVDQIRNSRLELRCLVNVSLLGLMTLAFPEADREAYLAPEAAAEAARRYPAEVRGIKVRVDTTAVGMDGRKALAAARKAADLAGLPLVVHITRPALPLAAVFEVLKTGDIITHTFHGKGEGILDPNGKVRSEVWEAREQGVLFDIAQGMNHLSFRVAEAALAQGFIPDFISTDWIARTALRPPVGDLATVVARFLAVGLDLPAALSRVTSRPAAFLDLPDYPWEIRPGAAADLVGWEVRETPWEVVDSLGEVRTAPLSLRPVVVIKGGQLIFRHQW